MFPELPRDLCAYLRNGQHDWAVLVFPEGAERPEITHDAINFHCVEKASEVSFFHNGAWIQRQGAD